MARCSSASLSPGEWSPDEIRALTNSSAMTLNYVFSRCEGLKDGVAVAEDVTPLA